MRLASFVMVAGYFIIFCGCTQDPKLLRADGTPADLRGYECVSLKSVEVDPKLGLSGLPGQLTPALQGELLQSERWAYRGPSPSVVVVSGHHMESRQPGQAGTNVETPASAPSSTSDNCRSVTLSVMITNMEIPTESERRFGKPRTMTCRVDVCDPQTGAPLGSAEVVARSGLTRGKQLLAQALVGPAGVGPPRDNEMDKSAALSAMAKAIVEILDSAKTAK